jgi:hypothetical protein
MNKLIERCEALLPSKEWERFRDLPYDAELMAKQDFVMEVLRGEPAPFPIAGFWFGLFNPVYDESTTADIYFGCGRTFDPDDEEWPTSIEFFPRTGYFHSGVLAQIYDLSQSTALGNDAEWPLVLAYGTYLARACVRRYTRAMGSRVGVVVGFDSGDTVELGVIGSRAHAAPPRPSARRPSTITLAPASGGAEWPTQ